MPNVNKVTKKDFAKAAAEVARDVAAGGYRIGSEGRLFNKNGSPCCGMGHVFVRAGFDPLKYDNGSRIDETGPADLFSELFGESPADEVDDAFYRVVNLSDNVDTKLSKNNKRYRDERRAAFEYEFTRISRGLTNPKKTVKLPKILDEAKYFRDYNPNAEY